MATKETTTAIATIEQTYPVLSGDGAEIMQALQENLAGERMSTYDFERVTVPAGGQLFWTLPSAGDEPPAKNLDGIIVHTNLERAYWERGLDDSGGGTPPDCSSPDSIMGHGTPGGPCDACQFSQFGSDAKGRGQACKQVRSIYLLREGSFLPTVLIVPPSSLASIKSYLFSLAAKGRVYSAVVSRFVLVADKNKDGINFARIEAKSLDSLTIEQTNQVKQYGQMIRATIAAAATQKKAA
jgi:hypothetical protein